MSCHMIAITNQKGGVGKTTVCSAYGGQLQPGRQTGYIYVGHYKDPFQQANTSVGAGIPETTRGIPGKAGTIPIAVRPFLVQGIP